MNNTKNNEKNKTKRIKCAKGTHWVKSAQKCMKIEEAKIFLSEEKKNKTKKIKPTKKKIKKT